MLKLTLIVNHDTFEIEGDVDLPAVHDVVDDWLAALPHVYYQQHALREITARLAESTTDLEAAIGTETGAVPLLTSPPRIGEDDMAIPDSLTDLNAEVTRATTVQGGAAALIRGIGARVQAGIDKAIGKGATEEQLAELTDEVAALKASSDDLTAAISENTPAAE